MSLFRWFSRSRTPDPTLTDLYERQRRLEGDMKALERDQVEAFDSMRRLLAKIRRSEKRAAEESSQDDPGSTIFEPDRVHPAEKFRMNQLARRRG